MAIKPRLITDYVSPIENTRSKLILEEKEKIKGAHGFVFNRFKTERQRIAEYLKREEEERNVSIIKNLSLTKMIKSPEDQTTSFLNKFQKRDSQSFLQPTMRFKPRTDMERIVNTIQKNSPAKVNTNILQMHLSKLELNRTKGCKKRKTKNPFQGVEISSDDEEEEDPFFPTSIKENDSFKDKKTIGILNQKNKKFMEKDVDKDIYKDGFSLHNNLTNIKNEKSMSKYLKKKQVDNSRAKQILEDLYIKTHFKAAIEIATHSKLLY